MVNSNITLYTADSANGWKISIALELLKLNYTVKELNIAKNEQKEAWYLKINPNGRVPAIVDHSNDDFKVIESGAILHYLVQRYDTEHKLWPKDLKLQSEVLQWVFFQVGGVGPMQGQAAHFGIYAPERIQYGIDRYLNETKRLFSVLETKLEGHDFIAADQLSIADLALFPWVSLAYRFAIDLTEYPNLNTWVERLDKIPEVVKGLDVPVPNNEYRFVRADPAKVKEELAKWSPDFYATN
ncbi:glutathione S-transferase GstA [Conidiobolus coronatus NRRL 28638]|uniref:Glutathione S-transferase GstA n=1 Tax=Conidiobolus coronatus (strain ATCC 28846 / CBS 209.66 / NRRL 28638) TaxID=796925 RepID=A0A137PDW8_CONC2|nr:glutathione S-transferase GstA [Conidiobolus coronatus NRRL 28638]|eukprot:KXN73131.1 glutathione S-transferase GstA [Conidiobolus coronatus NRRL 28638]